MLKYTMSAIERTFSFQPQLTDQFKIKLLNQYNELTELPVKEWMIVGKTVLYLQGLIQTLDEIEIWIVGPHRLVMREWFHENSERWHSDDDDSQDEYSDDSQDYDDDSEETFIPISYSISIDEIFITVKVMCYSTLFDNQRTDGFKLYLSIFERLSRNCSCHIERKALIIKESMLIDIYFSKCHTYKNDDDKTYKDLIVYNPPPLKYLALIKFLLSIYPRFHYLYWKLEVPDLMSESFHDFSDNDGDDDVNYF
ncbi:uncharacterized protein LOC123317555 isoform X2 [Coccinella septempunctata]|nr:uncharacterized protein LOC123317555 isoform X2 [Coccinella septempunctata]